MTLRITLFLTSTMLLFAPCVHATLQFAGFIQTGGVHRFVITQTSDGQVSGWLKIGDTFAGHTIVAFQEGDEVLILQGSGGEVRLPMKASRVEPDEPRVRRERQSTQSRQNTLSLQINVDGTIHDIEGVKRRLALMRPSLQSVIFSEMHLPSNAPLEAREYHAFLLPAMLAFDAICSEFGLKHQGGSIKPPIRPNKAPEPTITSVTPRASSCFLE